MVGPDPKMKGGIASVAATYLGSEYAQRVALRYHASTVEGGKLRKAWRSAGALLRFPAAARAFRPDVVHLHYASRLSFYRKLAYLLVAKALRLPTVVHGHSGTFPDFRDASALNARCVKLFLERADACIALSSTWQAVLAGYAPGARIHVVPNPVEAPELEAAAGAPGPGGEQVVLCLGRLGQAKGTYDLLRAIPLVLQSAPAARFVLAGDGAVEEVRRRVRALGLERAVELPGWVAGEAKLRQLARCAVYVLPSYREGMPVSILEAMAAGKPVVATPVGAVPELVEEGVNGYLVPAGDAAALAARVAALLLDAPLRRAQGERNRAKVAASYSMSAVAGRLIAVYESVRRA
ncbi:glycosyltransferase family 4 protein [Anaeromyxobacter diazotrophicus]|nr:glycosyltransferase [Anaeromyxobacter diazotrophicus]